MDPIFNGSDFQVRTKLKKKSLYIFPNSSVCIRLPIFHPHRKFGLPEGHVTQAVIFRVFLFSRRGEKESKISQAFDLALSKSQSFSARLFSSNM